MMARKGLLKNRESSISKGNIVKEKHNITKLCKLKYYLQFWNCGVSSVLGNAL